MTPPKVRGAMMKVALSLVFLLISLPGLSSTSLKEIHVKVGEMVTLRCPRHRGHSLSDTIPSWTSHTDQEVDLTNVPSAEQTRMGIVLYGSNLMILNASVNHQGNYSCSMGKKTWFWLKVNTKAQQYNQTCDAQQSCTLQCPDVNVPETNTPNITDRKITWHKEGGSQINAFDRMVKESASGLYICTRSFLYHGQLYNMTFRVALGVQPSKKPTDSQGIISPGMDGIVYVDLGLPMKIDCEAIGQSPTDDLSWSYGKSFVATNNSFPVFYITTCNSSTEGIKMTASLFFRKVSKEDLSKNYTCKLEIDGHSSSVTITLKQKSPPPSYLPLALSIVCIVVVMVLASVFYLKFRINITLFLRDTLGCCSSSSDGKRHDVFLMCYKSDTEVGLNEHDRKQLKNVLEDKHGYSLCLYDRDVLPGRAEAEAVLDCIEQSQTVVLVPTSTDTYFEFGMLSAIHAALVERQTRLVFIKTEARGGSASGSLPEALQLLSKAGHYVIWKGMRSMSPSSPFWKQLRYYLPAPQHAPKMMLLPQTSLDITS